MRFKDLLEMLGKLDLYGKHIRVVHNVYREQTICVREWDQ